MVEALPDCAKRSPPALRPDFLRQQRLGGDRRPRERLIAHYELERKLSDRLRQASREERVALYPRLYNELFASLPDHPQNCRSSGLAERVDAQLRKIGGYLGPHSVFLEIGCGDAALAFAAARRIAKSYGLDVTDALIDFTAAPPNFAFLRTSGVTIPLPDGEVDFVYSNQLMEHIHPEDTLDQAKEIYRVLRPGCSYMCITPSRATGPHDISCYFDYEANGFHLKEYDYGGLHALFRHAGFRKFWCFVGIKGREIRVPYFVLRAIERALLALPPRLRAYLTQFGPVRAAMGLQVIAVK